MFSRISAGLRKNRTGAEAAGQAHSRGFRVAALRLVAQMGRVQMIPALVMPVLWGAAFARWQVETVSIWRAFVVLFSFAALGLSYNFLSAYLDFRRHVQLDGRPQPPPPGTEPDRRLLAGLFDGYDWLQQGLLHRQTFLSLGLMSGTIFVLSAVWLGFFVGWPFWFFAGVSALLSAAALWPVLRYSRRFWWLGEVAFWLGLGVVPLVGSYFSLTGSVTRAVLWIAVAAATFSWLAAQSYTFYSWHRDWRLRKRTLVVVLGPERALDSAAMFAAAGFITLILLMATGAVPVWTILVLGAFPLFLRAFARTRVWPFSRQAGIATVEHAINATILAGLLWFFALWLA